MHRAWKIIQKRISFFYYGKKQFLQDGGRKVEFDTAGQEMGGADG